MSKTDLNSNAKTYEIRQVSHQVNRDSLPITAQNIKPPAVKPPKPPQQESQSQPPQNRN